MFDVTVGAHTWKDMTKDLDGGFVGQMRGQELPARLSPRIVAGMHSNACPQTWMIDRAAYNDDATVYMCGHCANATERSLLGGDHFGLAKLVPWIPPSLHR